MVRKAVPTSANQRWQSRWQADQSHVHQTNHMSIRPITCPLDSHSAAQRREVAWDSSVETIVIQANLEDLGHVGEATRYGASEAIGRKVQESQWQIPKEARDAAGQAFHMP